MASLSLLQGLRVLAECRAAFPPVAAAKTPYPAKRGGTKGVLAPKKMGKNGDQIQRLFKSPAAVFLVQYWGQVDQSVTEQMEEFAKAKSAVEGTEIYFAVIDGDDSNRLLKAYPRAFET